MQKNKKKVKRFSVILLVALFALVGYFCVRLISVNVDIKNQEAANAALQKTLTSQENKNAELEAILNKSDKDAYIERIARENGYAGANERVYCASDNS